MKERKRGLKTAIWQERDREREIGVGGYKDKWYLKRPSNNPYHD